MTELYVDSSIDERGVATMSLMRPDVHNAFDDQMISQMIQILDSLRENPEVRVLILRSEGKNFSAGADLNWMRSMAEKNYQQNLEDAGQLAQLMYQLDQFPKPTIALVQGAAFGGAVGLVACCDIVIAQHRASFCLSEVKIGLIPAAISPYVVKAMGERQARRYFVTAERFSATTAQEIGLVHEVDDNLELALKPILDSLLLNGPAATTAAKSLVKLVAFAPINQGLIDETSRRIAEIRVSPEGQEGLGAFLDKRTPNWVDTSEGEES